MRFVCTFALYLKVGRQSLQSAQSSQLRYRISSHTPIHSVHGREVGGHVTSSWFLPVHIIPEFPPLAPTHDNNHPHAHLSIIPQRHIRTGQGRMDDNAYQRECAHPFRDRGTCIPYC
eukprot:332878-Pyramimonas_sp.AAC.1